jgi:prolyl oligopeptidase
VLTERLMSSQPVTRVEDVSEVLHGVSVSDPYRWLEKSASAEVQEWTSLQTSYTRSLLDALPFRQKIATKLADLMKIDSYALPTVRNCRLFFTRRQSHDDQHCICMRQADSEADEIIVDPHPLSAEHMISVELMSVSRDGRYIAYAQRIGGEDEVVIKLWDVNLASAIADVFPKGRYWTCALTTHGEGLYYTRLDDTGPLLRYHVIGTDTSQDVIVFGKSLGRDHLLAASLSDDDRYLIIEVRHGLGGTYKTELYLQDLSKQLPPRAVITGVDAQFIPRVACDDLFLLTNLDAPRWKVVRADLSIDHTEFRDVVPEGDHVIEGLALVGGRLVVQYLDNVCGKLRVFDSDGTFTREIPLPATGTVSRCVGNWFDRTMYFSFSSLH